jgi:prepilin-type N-terminal cleavage/methylation domain-containing protein
MLSKNSRQFKTQKAFTLIELLVVIAIVGILAGLAVVSMSRATEAAKIAKSKVFSNSVRNSLLASRVSEWNFDEGTGTSTADTVGGNTGILINGPAWRPSADCVSGGCLEFDGSNDYVDTVGNVGIIGAQARTVTLWFKPTDKQGRQDLFSFGTPALSLMFNILFDYIPDESLYWGAYADDTAGHANTITRNEWNFVAVAYDGSIVNVYINGSSRPDISASHTISTGASTLWIGKSKEDQGYYKGLMDEFRIYSAALTASAIRDQYIAGLDKLLVSNQITDEEYQQRSADLNLNYAVK